MLGIQAQMEASGCVGLVAYVVLCTTKFDDIMKASNTQMLIHMLIMFIISMRFGKCKRV